jgi:uncharacterized protein
MPSIEQARSWYPDDPVHGFDHVLRVYHLAEKLAGAEGADLEIVQAAALLHDVPGELAGHDVPGELAGHDVPGELAGHDVPESVTQESGKETARAEHHNQAARFARRVLGAEGWTDERINRVVHCIEAHRFRDKRTQPDTIEAQVLFDADKLDAIGATGVGRAIAYAASHGQPVYAPPSDEFLRSGRAQPGEPHSSYHEHLFKLRKIKERLYTQTGRRLAQGRHEFLEAFYEQLLAEYSGER